MRNEWNARKTVSVGEMLFRANTFMVRSAKEQVGERKGTFGLMETMLHATGNYCGFGYLEHTTSVVDDKTVHDLGDESRVFFYVGTALRADYAKAEKASAEN